MRIDVTPCMGARDNMDISDRILFRAVYFSSEELDPDLSRSFLRGWAAGLASTILDWEICLARSQGLLDGSALRISLLLLSLSLSLRSSSLLERATPTSLR